MNLGEEQLHWSGCWSRWIWLSIKKGNVLMEDSGSRGCDICACDSNPWQREHNDRDSLHAPKRERERKRVSVCVTVLTLILRLNQSKNMQWGPDVTYGIDGNEEEEKRERAWGCHLPWHNSIAYRLGLLVSSCHICTILHHSFNLFPHCHCQHISFINQTATQHNNVFQITPNTYSKFDIIANYLVSLQLI